MKTRASGIKASSVRVCVLCGGFGMKTRALGAREQRRLWQSIAKALAMLWHENPGTGEGTTSWRF
jgi:hypothetical protein